MYTRSISEKAIDLLTFNESKRHIQLIYTIEITAKTCRQKRKQKDHPQCTMIKEK